MLSSASIGHCILGSLRRASLSPPTRLPAGRILAALRSSHLLTRTLLYCWKSFFFPRSRMDQQAIQIHGPPLEEAEMFWASIEGLLGDLPTISGGSPGGLQGENYGTHCEDAVPLEGPQDEANLKDLFSGPLLYTNAHYQTKYRRSGKRGTRKRRTSPWNPMFFGSRVTGVSRKYIGRRKNNSRWTAKEVDILVQGVSKFGVGRWAMLKQQFFRTSIRTSVHLKDKWRNLLKAYQGNSQKTTLLYLEPSLVEQIRKLAGKQLYLNKRHK